MKKLILIAVVLVALIAPVHADVTLYWDTNTDADSYTVYMRETGQIVWGVQKSDIKTNTLSLPLPKFNQSYDFSVKAFNTCGNSSEYSDVVTFNQCAVSTPKKPLNLKIILNVSLDPPTPPAVTATVTSGR